ncbi:hypothetical protein VTN96DRAFT_7981 [Rasamsonia emersonii]
METWSEHAQRCKNHEFTECPRHGYVGYLRYCEAQEAISGKKKMWNQDYTCNWENCLCQHYDQHRQHSELPWTVCYTTECVQHREEKQKAGWFPEPPKITEGFHEYCPCNRTRCACIGYQRHPHHDGINWRFCYDDQCMIHYRAKEAQHFPVPPRRERRPRWRSEQHQLAGTAYGKHMKLEEQQGTSWIHDIKKD